MPKVIQCVHYPVVSTEQIFFVKEIIKVVNGHWMVVTTCELSEAQRFGDEAQLVVDGLKCQATYVGDPMEDDADYTPPTLNVITIL